MMYFRFNIHDILRGNVSKEFGNKSKASPQEFKAYFAKWANFKLLLATTVCWFVFNVSFFGINLNTGIIIEAIGFSSNLQDDLWYTLLRNSIGILIITILGLIPGYW
jgi:PHS family inorganic phosphate transporter-like MFS transporter